MCESRWRKTTSLSTQSQQKSFGARFVLISFNHNCMSGCVCEANSCARPQLAHAWAPCLSLSLFLSLAVFLCIIRIHMYPCLSVCVHVCVSVCLSVCTYVCMSVSRVFLDLKITIFFFQGQNAKGAERDAARAAGSQTCHHSCR